MSAAWTSAAWTRAGALLALLLAPAGGRAGSDLSPACPERQHLELSRPLSAAEREICIRPGVMTGLLFDEPASVDLQDEVRFAEVLRGARGISFVPPPDLTAGERLRLTVHFRQGTTPTSTTLLLVAYPGRATRQVDVFHDGRSRDTLVRELQEEHASNERLREENQALRARLEQPIRLRQLFLGGTLGARGIEARSLLESFTWRSEGPLSMLGGVSYRGVDQVAVVVLLRNNGPEAWTLATASLTGPEGEPLRDVSFVQPGALEPQGIQRVFIEATVGRDSRVGPLRLSLLDAGERGITLPHIPLP